jgi:hypothetical protein
MLFCEYVVDLKRQRQRKSRHPTILASITSPLPDFSDRFSIHCLLMS